MKPIVLTVVVLILQVHCFAAPKQMLRGNVVDAETGQSLPARIYIQGEEGGWHHVTSTARHGSAVRYEKRNWINAKSEEFHTTVSAHPFAADLPPGRYVITVERGKEYGPVTQTVSITDAPVSLEVPMTRWIDMAQRGWYSGDTHVHRSLADLPNIMLAEDLNVSFPLTYWVTHAYQAPTQGDKTVREPVPNALIEIDQTHVIWPRNTEWEIFSVGERRHTLGAVFALGHREPFDAGVPPVKQVAAEARRQGALLDLDKHDWPWTMTLPPSMGVHLYELANNHIWRTEFAFTQWNSPTPEYLRPPLQEQSGTEREWILYTMANYYALLNGGLPMVPTAGTANGVHPVPLGFGRVYVHLPQGFRYEGWKAGLRAGRSFVTTGPMVFATVNGQPPGERFEGQGQFTAEIQGEILSEQALAFAEVMHNGRPVRTLMGRNERTATGAFRTVFSTQVALNRSGWLALRCWEDRAGGRVRYAHTAPWHVTLPGQPLRPQPAERAYLIERVKIELERSRGLLPAEAIQEYEEALSYYEGLAVREDTSTSTQADVSSWVGTPGRVSIAPYAGQRHPRIGFLDGAMDPQRETKVTVFAPWDPSAYVVVDVPEAIWSNLGLTYLAHTHIDTIWDQQGVTLPAGAWTRQADGSLTHERRLPNGIAFGARVVAHERHVAMELWLKNGSQQHLTDLRVQNCVMLKGAAGFNAQSNWNKHLAAPFAAVHSDDGQRWIITAWQRCQRAWANPPVPCFHADPQFKDLAPGETGHLKGWLWFVEGADIQRHVDRLAEAYPVRHAPAAGPHSTNVIANPILPSGADPWVVRGGDHYYLCQSRRGGLWVNRSTRLQDIGQNNWKRVWTPTPNTAYSKELWAPELHRVMGKWYIYVAADDGDNHNHRMIVLEGTSDDPQDPFLFKGKIATPSDRWGIDGTVLQMPDGRLFFIWSGWDGSENVAQHLYIAAMSNAWTLSGRRVKIATPELAWELHGRPLINEGPQVLWNEDKLFVIFSASGSWTDDYCLGQLAWTGGDPLDPKAWIKKPDPVFSRTEDVFGPGHASFVKSRDSREDWIVYHSAKHSGAGWNRRINMQRFTWNPDGSPCFGDPISVGVPLSEPSGDSLKGH